MQGKFWLVKLYILHVLFSSLFYIGTSCHHIGVKRNITTQLDQKQNHVHVARLRRLLGKWFKYHCNNIDQTIISMFSLDLNVIASVSKCCILILQKHCILGAALSETQSFDNFKLTRSVSAILGDTLCNVFALTWRCLHVYVHFFTLLESLIILLVENTFGDFRWLLNYVHACCSYFARGKKSECFLNYKIPWKVMKPWNMYISPSTQWNVSPFFQVTEDRQDCLVRMRFEFDS